MGDDDDRRRVIAHELSHVKNHDILLSTVVAVLVGLLVFVSDWVTRGMFWGRMGDDDDRRSNAIGFAIFLLFLLITPLLATLIQLAISRQREFLADASGALLSRNPDALAAALAKISDDPHILHNASNATAHLFIESPFKVKSKSIHWLANLFSTHPPVEERIRLLREM
jgi:heat shock protein HtpX